MQSLLESCEGNPLTQALCGRIFEPHAIQMLESGGEFLCRELVHGNTRARPEPMKIKILPSIQRVAEDVLPDQIMNQLYVPKTRNFVSIDAWIPGTGAFQMTVGKNHGITNAPDLRQKLDSLKGPLYWILPPLHFGDFTKQTPQDIHQYALLIPYPPVLDPAAQVGIENSRSDDASFPN